MSSPEAPAIRRAVASKAASIFSLTISLASRRALLPPAISFIIRSATTPFASTANIIKELNIRCPPQTFLHQGETGEIVPGDTFDVVRHGRHGKILPWDVCDETPCLAMNCA
jgi:hypothetical protein